MDKKTRERSKVKTKIILFMFVSGFSLLASAKTIYVLKTKGTVDSRTHLSAITELIEASVEGEKGFSVTGNRWKADFELRSRLTQLGSKYILTVFKSHNKKTLNSQKMTSRSLEDMDVVVARVVRAVLRGEEAAANSKVNEVTEEEQVKSSRRFKAHKQWVFALGASSATNLNESGSFKSFGFGRNWNIDPDYDLAFLWTTHISPSGSAASLVNLSIDLLYYFNKNKSAPFLVGGIGYAGAAADDDAVLFFSDDTAGGFSAKLGGGMRFFRTSTVNLGVSLTHTMMFADTTKSNKKPAVTSFQLQIFY